MTMMMMMQTVSTSFTQLAYSVEQRSSIEEHFRELENDAIDEAEERIVELQ